MIFHGKLLVKWTSIVSVAKISMRSVVILISRDMRGGPWVFACFLVSCFALPILLTLFVADKKPLRNCALFHQPLFAVMLTFPVLVVCLQLQQSEISATRSGTLVQELYIENAKLTKALQHTEANEKRAEKANRQLTEQKRALQRVISKLCGANAIA